MDSGTDGGGPSAKKAKLEATNSPVTLNLALADSTTGAATPKLLEMSQRLQTVLLIPAKSQAQGKSLLPSRSLQLCSLRLKRFAKVGL